VYFTHLKIGRCVLWDGLSACPLIFKEGNQKGEKLGRVLLQYCSNKPQNLFSISLAAAYHKYEQIVQITYF
jgi:hypothetical protein